jgi:hydrogenase nickel incorporation protein HypA/HybF
MHEMGIALQIIEIATASLPADLGEARVAAVNLKIGKLAAVLFRCGRQRHTACGR